MGAFIFGYEHVWTIQAAHEKRTPASSVRIITAHGSFGKWGELLRNKSEVLLNGTNALFEPFNSFLYLTIRKLDEGARLSELFVKMGSFLGVVSTQMHLKPFGDQLKLMPEPFSEDASVTSSISNICSEPFREGISVTSDIGNICPK